MATQENHPSSNDPRAARTGLGASVATIENGQSANDSVEKGESDSQMTVAQFPIDRQVSMLTYVFDALDADYGARWNANQQALTTVDGALTTYGARWIDQLAGRTRADILRGLRRLRHERPEWPPGAAGFAQLCTPTAEDMGLPDVEIAYRMACSSDWSIGAVWAAAKVVGTGRLRNLPERQTRKAFERIWSWVVEQAQQGRVFDLPPENMPALPYLQPVPDRYEEHRQALATGQNPFDYMRQMLKQ